MPATAVTSGLRTICRYDLGKVFTSCLRNYLLYRALRFRPVCVDGANWERISGDRDQPLPQKNTMSSPFFVTSIRLRCKLDDSVQRNLDIGQVNLREVVKICISGKRLQQISFESLDSDSQATEDGLCDLDIR
jgi:hypothetical protein